jgi:uncharacterized protein (DUF433 family)
VAAFYTVADCARLLHRPNATVREWTLKGLAPSRSCGERTSSPYAFLDLITLHVVAELRERGIPLQRIRRAEEWLRKDRGIPSPFATQRLYTAGKDILTRLADDGAQEVLVAATRQGQEAIEEAFEAILQSVDYDTGTSVIWHPWADVEVSARRQFGAPCVAGTGIQTSMIYKLVQAGDDPMYLATVYALPVAAVTHAVSWEESLVAAAA